MPTPPPPETLTLAVLAGGAGSRMGRPKSRLEIGGVPILSRLLDRLAWAGPTMLVTAPGVERPPGAARFDVEVIDPVADEGPLRGVHTALTCATTDAVVFVAVDMPAVTRADLEWFVAALAARPHALGVMALRDRRTIEPLPCALRRSAGELVSGRLTSSRRSLHGLTDDPRVARVDAAALPDRVWLNVNTPAEWDAFLRGALC